MVKFSYMVTEATRETSLRLPVAAVRAPSWNSCQNLTAEKNAPPRSRKGQVFHSLLIALGPVDCGNLLLTRA
jgi:hypothetical protein